MHSDPYTFWRIPCRYVQKNAGATKLVIDIPRCINFYLPSEYSVPGPGLQQVASNIVAERLAERVKVH